MIYVWLRFWPQSKDEKGLLKDFCVFAGGLLCERRLLWEPLVGFAPYENKHKLWTSDSCANASRVQYVVRAALSRAHYYRGFSRVFIPVVHVLPNSRQDLFKKRSSVAFSHLSHWFVVTIAIFRFSFPTASPVQQPCIINHPFKAPGCGIISPLFAAFCKNIG